MTAISRFDEARYLSEIDTLRRIVARDRGVLERIRSSALGLFAHGGMFHAILATYEPDEVVQRRLLTDIALELDGIFGDRS